MASTWRFAWRNIWRQPRRTILSILAIAFGAGLLVFSIGIQLGQYDLMIQSSIRIYHGLLQVQKEGYLDEPKMRTSIADISSLASDLRKLSGLDAISARANGFALVSSDKRTYGTMIVGVQPEFEKKISSLPGVIKEGRYLSSDSADEIIIGRSLARNMQIKLGDEVTILGSGRDGSVAATIVPVVGIYESGSRDLDRNLIQMPLISFQQVFEMNGHGHSIVIYDEDVKQLDALRLQFQDLTADYKDLVTLSWDEIQPGVRQMIELDYASGWLMYIVLVAIITFSILNTFLMSVLERTREFGIMLALGYTPFNIGRLVMLEAFILTLVGLAVGTLIGVAINYYFYVYGLTFSGMEEIAKMYNMPATITPQISFESVFLGPAMILLFTLLAALYPATRIRKLQPVEAMHSI
ncbi:MAG: FtsX-like permease family protein [Gammaproteobacteria bacterium]|nr:FtsX-like permease family protein [Gammaproteobacteria bacterium]MCW9005960.1 FtsX-like permease family protein [Gammaproteobacteria bacterium]MCW9055301.1 FtsX-like permease family protein [Gammaproteobacteria bacterium]